MEIKEVTIVGAGTMGTGIASAVISSGLKANLIDINEELLKKAEKGVEKILSRSVEKEKMTEADKVRALGNISFTTNLNKAESSQLIIEAVSENTDIKKKIFSKLAGIVSDGAIIGSNTSALKISELATSSKQPDKVIGMHFFNPVPAMKLVELVKTDLTSEQTFDTAKKFVLKLGKEAVTVRESPGFIVNRVLIPMINEAAILFGEKVATAEDIDKAMALGANHPIGPLALADLIGLDVCLAIMETLKEQLKSDKYEPAPVLRALVAAGKLGKKSGSGFHDYK
jgi:3-hydroxybutyryl-CoA dehydrogenase